MLRTILSLLLLLLFTCLTKGQEFSVMHTYIVQSDSLVVIELDEVKVIGKKKKNRSLSRAQSRQTRLEYNVKKVYPYALLAAEKIGEIDKKILAANNKKQEKELIKTEYKELMKTFKKPLMSLSISQGKILIRLIYRETENSSFYHIKEYKGAANAYFWQSLAVIFGHNLKAEYDAEGEDAEIEAVVQKIIKGEI